MIWFLGRFLGGAGQGARRTVILKDVIINGSMLAEGDLEIMGAVRGDVSCKELVLHRCAELGGAIKSQNIRFVE